MFGWQHFSSQIAFKLSLNPKQIIFQILNVLYFLKVALIVPSAYLQTALDRDFKEKKTHHGVF